MRLIDADNLQLNLWVPSRNNAIVKAFENSVIDALDRQPTVKAIPVEWIKSKIDTILDSYPDGNEETEILCKLLYDWEKENEDNN